MRADVPSREPGPIYAIPQGLLFACGFGCVALGVSRAGLDTTIELCSDKRPRFGTRPLCEDPVIQRQIGMAEAKWRAAKAMLFDAAGSVWRAVKATGEITMEHRIALRMAGTHAIRQSAEVVDIAYNLSGSTSIFHDRAIQRRFQDIHVITQQVQGREAHYEDGGTVLSWAGTARGDLRGRGASRAVVKNADGDVRAPNADEDVRGTDFDGDVRAVQISRRACRLPRTVVPRHRRRFGPPSAAAAWSPSSRR